MAITKPKLPPKAGYVEVKVNGQRRYRSIETGLLLGEQTAETIRIQRDSLLAACDWTQMVDSPLSEEEKAAYQTYRQALRDVPQQEDFPETINWPEEPKTGSFVE